MDLELTNSTKKTCQTPQRLCTPCLCVQTQKRARKTVDSHPTGDSGSLQWHLYSSLITFISETQAAPILTVVVNNNPVNMVPSQSSDEGLLATIGKLQSLLLFPLPFVLNFPPKNSIRKYHISPVDCPPTLLHLNSPLQWKTSLSFSNTSANHRTSLTNCITYSGSIPGAPARWDVRPMLLSELRFLEPQLMFQDLTDPDDRDPVWGLWECCLGRTLLPASLLLLLLRSIPAASAAVLPGGNSRADG